MPSWELFEQQSQDYRDTVIPPSITARVYVEQASTFDGVSMWVQGVPVLLCIHLELQHR